MAATSVKPVATKSTKAFTIRPVKPKEIFTVGRIAALTYYNSRITKFLSPKRLEYADHYIRGFQQRAVTRYLDPSTDNIVACNAERPDEIIGYIQICRKGDDSGAKAQIARRKTLWLWIAGWLWWVWVRFYGWWAPDLSADVKAAEGFARTGKIYQKEHWEREDRKNRWHVLSLVVRDEWQGNGVGKALMGVVMERARVEGVPLGLEASPEGEPVYNKLGLKLLGRFTSDPEHADAGGIMMWDPRTSTVFETKKEI